MPPAEDQKMGNVQLPEPQAWLPAPMLGGDLLTDDASLRDYNGGIGCHVASVLEETLLLPKDMVELRELRRNEVFLQTKMISRHGTYLSFHSFFFNLLLLYIYIFFTTLYLFFPSSFFFF